MSIPKRVYFTVLLIALVLMPAWGRAAAQSGFPRGYEITFSPPRADMHPLGYGCAATIYDASGGGLVPLSVPVTVDAYVVWLIPPRQADYQLRFELHGASSVVIWSQETLDAICKP